MMPGTDDTNRAQDGYEDRTIECIDCATPFVWVAGEQRFYAARGFETPKRCRPCRQKARERAERLGGPRLA